MKRNRRDPVGAWDGLEPRIVLSAGLRPTHAVVTIQNDIPLATGPQARRASARIEQAFNQFRNTYFSTLNLYLTPPNNTLAGKMAFDNATVQEVYFLAENLIQQLLPVNGSTQRQKHEQPPIQTIVNNRILAKSPTSLTGGLGLASPPPGTTVAGDALYVTAAKSAIDAAEATVQNGVRILRLGSFSGSHHH